LKPNISSQKIRAAMCFANVYMQKINIPHKQCETRQIPKEKNRWKTN
jgi:hypothetical protein